MCLFLNKVERSLLVFAFCGLAEISRKALRTSWISVMIMFCVSHVRISSHFIKNMSALTGWQWWATWPQIQGRPLVRGSHLSFRALWSLVPDIWRQDGITASSFIGVSLETIWSPFKKCLWSRMSLRGSRFFVYLLNQRIVFPLYCCPCIFCWKGWRPSWLWAFSLLNTPNIRQSPSAGSGHSKIGISSLHEVSWRWYDFRVSSFCEHSEGWRCEIWLPLRLLCECECWFHKPSMKRVYEQTLQMLRLAMLCQRKWWYSATRFSISRRLMYFHGFNFLQEILLLLLLLTDLNSVVSRWKMTHVFLASQTSQISERSKILNLSHMFTW